MRRREFIGNLIGTAVAWPLGLVRRSRTRPKIGQAEPTAPGNRVLLPIYVKSNNPDIQ
jgi:hypothetical protein